jgi:hypothetical protein
MVAGFLKDATARTALGREFGVESEWVEGKPEAARLSWWYSNQLDYGKLRRLSVTTYRCEQCGFLESYAGAENCDPGAEGGATES